MLFGKKGQVTIFVIVAILIIVAGLSYFMFRDVSKKEVIPTSIEPVNTQFVQCIEDYTLEGISLLEANGGHIDSVDFSPGSRYYPSSSKLTFAGAEIPYWFYVSGAGISRTQVPELEDMEKELSSYLEDKIKLCSLQNFINDGYNIEKGLPIANVFIQDDYVDVSLDMNLFIQKGDEASSITSHETRINSNLGTLYSEAKGVFEKENTDYFLENYSIDVLRLYTPVDGVELTCSPMVWSANEIYNNLTEALEVNTMSLTNIGPNDDYFVLDLSTEAKISFMYSKDWPTYFEVNPTDNGVLVAKPVGNEQGLGILGFCYVPYHFVYNLRHPVMVRLEKDGESFQFPTMVLIEGNVPRTSRKGESIASNAPELCNYKNSEISVSVYDTDLNPVDAEIRFDCFGSTCDIGTTSNGELKENFPQCVNGFINTKAEGYQDSRTIFSTVNEGSLVVILDKLYEKDLELNFGGKKYSGNAIVTFSGEDETKTIIYPEQKSINLSQGFYNISVMLFEESTLKLPESSEEYCIDAPRSGLLGLAGLTQKQCSTITVPSQLISNALVGGGETVYSFVDSDLSSSEKIIIVGDEINVPTSLDELQNNYILIDTNALEVRLE